MLLLNHHTWPDAAEDNLKMYNEMEVHMSHWEKEDALQWIFIKYIDFAS